MQDNEGTEVSISQKMERKRAASHTHGSDRAAVLRHHEKAREYRREVQAVAPKKMSQREGCERKGGVSVRPEVDKQHRIGRARVNQHQVDSEVDAGRTGEHGVQLA